MSWTDERIAVLKKMWKNGSSAADIAKTLGKGVTRNAVIGKAHRMGLSGRPSPIKKKSAAGTTAAAKKTKTTGKTATKTKTAVKSTPAKTKTADKTPKSAKEVKTKTSAKSAIEKPSKEEVAAILNISMNTPPKDGGVALIDLTERMCKWPYGDPQEDDFTFCGRAIHPGTPYCPEHAVMAYQSSSKSRAASKARAKAAAAEEAEMEDEIDVDDIDDDEVDEDNVGNVD